MLPGLFGAMTSLNALSSLKIDLAVDLLEIGEPENEVVGEVQAAVQLHSGVIDEVEFRQSDNLVFVFLSSGAPAQAVRDGGPRENAWPVDES